MSSDRIEQAIEYWKTFWDEIDELRHTPGTDPEEWDEQENATAAALEALVKQRHYEDMEEQGRLIELPCAVGETDNCKMYTQFRAEIDAMYSPLVLDECDEVIEIMHNTQQIGLLCVKDKYIQGLYILPKYRRMGFGKTAVLNYIKKYGMPKDLTILNTNYDAITFWNSIFELEVIKANPIDTYYKIKRTKEEAEAKLKELEGDKE